MIIMIDKWGDLTSDECTPAQALDWIRANKFKVIGGIIRSKGTQEERDAFEELLQQNHDEIFNISAQRQRQAMADLKIKGIDSVKFRFPGESKWTDLGRVKREPAPLWVMIVLEVLLFTSAFLIGMFFDKVIKWVFQ